MELLHGTIRAESEGEDRGSAFSIESGRYGGEEFVIGCPNTGLSEAMLIAKKLCRGIASLDIQLGAQIIQLLSASGQLL